MGRERRNQLVLGGLIVVLGAAMYREWPRTAAPVPAASNNRGSPRTPGGEQPISAPDVHLEALQQQHPKPGDADRNLFRFRPKGAAPPPPTVAKPSASAPLPPPVPTGPPPPTPPPPIAMKFIGIVEVKDKAQKIAVLTDARGVYIGSEGGMIEGRFRILKIGTESIEIAYADGRGRQTIRLTGQ